MPMPIVLGRDPQKRREEKNKKHPKVIPSAYLHFQTHAPKNITPVAAMSAYIIVGIVRVAYLPLMTSHRWELLLPASFVAMGDHQSYTSTMCSRISFVDI
jgi:hypothetical protein